MAILHALSIALIVRQPYQAEESVVVGGP